MMKAGCKLGNPVSTDDIVLRDVESGCYVTYVLQTVTDR